MSWYRPPHPLADLVEGHLAHLETAPMTPLQRALLAKLRRAILPSASNPAAAAYYALIIGAGAGDQGRAALRRELRRQHQPGGHARGAQIAKAATRDDADIRRHARRWQMSDELQDQFPTTAEYVRRKTGLSKSTVYRRLKALKLSQ